MTKIKAQETFKKNLELTREMFGYVNRQVAIQFTRADIQYSKARGAARNSLSHAARTH